MAEAARDQNGSFSTDLRSVPARESCTFTLDYVFMTEGAVALTIDDFVSSLGPSDATTTALQVTPPHRRYLIGL